jgi:ATP-dependent Clp protease adaptor protein ClpS
MDNRKEKSSNFYSEQKVDEYKLILVNDDFNTFDYVIQCLVEICNFDYERAEQCTLLTHLKGEYQILSGDLDSLETIKQKLFSKNITTKILKK